jgi:hypothetical protein
MPMAVTLVRTALRPCRRSVTIVAVGTGVPGVILTGVTVTVQ